MIRFLFLLLFVGSYAFGQGGYEVKYINQTINIDGKLDEEAWQKAEVLKNFRQYFPSDSGLAVNDTEIRMFYDDKNLYISAKMYSKAKNYIIPSLRRDFRAGGNDNITFCFDTFADHTNGFMFGTNPYGVMREGLMFNAASDNSFLNIFWDNKWKSNSYIADDAWISESVIPFSTLRFKEGSQLWFFKAYRFDTQTNEQTSLVKMPQNQIIMSLGYTIPIKFERPLRKNGANVALIPYIASKVSKDFEAKDPATIYKSGIGLDAKIGVTSGLNLDLTINPDFSNVEADRQVVNQNSGNFLLKIQIYLLVLEV
jgi:hypothetical protein